MGNYYLLVEICIYMRGRVTGRQQQQQPLPPPMAPVQQQQQPTPPHSHQTAQNKAPGSTNSPAAEKPKFEGMEEQSFTIPVRAGGADIPASISGGVATRDSPGAVPGLLASPSHILL